MSQFAVLNNDVSGTSSGGGDLTLQAGVRVRVLRICSFLHEQGIDTQVAIIRADGVHDSIVVLTQDLDLEPFVLPTPKPLPLLTSARFPAPAARPKPLPRLTRAIASVVGGQPGSN